MALEINKNRFENIVRLDTPVDERGLVDLEQLAVDLGKVYRHPGIEIPENLKERNTHHLYYDEADYIEYDLDNGTDIASKFRERRINKILLPVSIHRDLHDVFNKPKIPDLDVMEDVINSEFSLMVIYNSAKRAIRWKRDLAYLLGELKSSKDRHWFPREQLISKINGAEDIAKRHCEIYADFPIEKRVLPSLNPERPLGTVAKKIGEFLNLREATWKMALPG